MGGGSVWNEWNGAVSSHACVSLSLSLSLFRSPVSELRTLTWAGGAQRQCSVKSERRAAEAERVRAEHYRAHC